MKTEGSISSTQKFLEAQKAKKINNDLDMTPESKHKNFNSNIYTAPHLQISI